MTAKHPITSLCIWAYDEGFSIIAIKHILKLEFNIRGRRVTDAISKSLGPRQLRMNEKSYSYISHEAVVKRITTLDDLLTFFDGREYDYWTIKQLLKLSPIWDTYDSQIIWRRFQRIQRREQRSSLKKWRDRSLTQFVLLNDIYSL